MPKNSYRCECGKVFKTAQGLAGHQRFCKKTIRRPEVDESIPEWKQRFSELEKSCKTLSDQHAAALKKVNRLEELVNLLVGYVCPGGKNFVGVNSSRIIELSFEIDKAKKEMQSSQLAFTREIKSWVWNVIPEQFRPKL